MNQSLNIIKLKYCKLYYIITFRPEDYKLNQEHIKSSIGIENIASQRVHEVMREKGLWNFRFELLEQCPKDQLGEREKYYIEFFDSQSYGYNQVSGSAYKDKGDS